jgi:hypothetical protein
MDYTNLKSLTIPEGKVAKILRNGQIIWKSEKLPEEYQELEWICAENGAGTYINLGFAFDTAAKIYMDLWIDTLEVGAYPFGAVENSGALRCCLSAPYSGRAVQYGSNGTAFIDASKAGNLALGKNELVMTYQKGLLKL